jgi:hypothetical protein
VSYLKAPAAVLEYQFNWAGNPAKKVKPWLAEGETITNHQVVVPAGLTQVGESTVSGGVVTVWIAGGSVSAYYQVTCHITTSAGRQDSRSVRITVRDR